MVRQRKKCREYLFNVYAMNLSQTVPGFKDTFRCPICLKNFDSSALAIDQELTLGHIVPEATGGNKCVLECGYCNHCIGTAYDSHIALEKKDAMWNSGAIGSKKLIRLESGGRDAAAWSIWENGQTLAFKPTDMEDPNYKHLLHRFTDKRQQNTEINLNMSFQDKLIPEKRDVSLDPYRFLDDVLLFRL